MTKTADKLPPAHGIRFGLRALPGMVFVRFPVELPPLAPILGVVTGDGWQTGGRFRDGRWWTMGGKPFARRVLHWTATLDDKGQPISG